MVYTASTNSKVLNNSKDKPNNYEKQKNRLLNLFFNSSKHWRFQELFHKANITRPQLSRWLKILQDEHIIQRIKNKGKMPYYISNCNNAQYKTKKRLYGLNTLENLISYLLSSDAELIILFGSFCKSDWHIASDVDLFIYKANNMKIDEFERDLSRNIQVFSAQSKQDLIKIGSNLINSILEGIIIKGDIKVLLNVQK